MVITVAAEAAFGSLFSLYSSAAVDAVETTAAAMDAAAVAGAAESSVLHLN